MFKEGSGAKTARAAQSLSQMRLLRDGGALDRIMPTKEEAEACQAYEDSVNDKRY